MTPPTTRASTTRCHSDSKPESDAAERISISHEATRKLPLATWMGSARTRVVIQGSPTRARSSTASGDKKLISWSIHVALPTAWGSHCSTADCHASGCHHVIGLFSISR